MKGYPSNTQNPNTSALIVYSKSTFVGPTNFTKNFYAYFNDSTLIDAFYGTQ